MGDNVGGGAPGDGTARAHALMRDNVGPSFVCLYDPQAAAIARTAGLGAVIDLTCGGRLSQSGPPLHFKGRVAALHPGKFSDPETRHGGNVHYDMGPASVVELEGRGRSGTPMLTVMLTSKPMMPASLKQLTCCGLHPQSFAILIAKGVHAPVAAYGPVCTRLIRVNTPGVTSADLRGMEYHCARNSDGGKR